MKTIMDSWWKRTALIVALVLVLLALIQWLYPYTCQGLCGHILALLQAISVLCMVLTGATLIGLAGLGAMFVYIVNELADSNDLE